VSNTFNHSFVISRFLTFAFDAFFDRLTVYLIEKFEDV